MKKVIKNISVLAALLCTLSLSPYSYAGIINADAGWYGFCFDDVGSGAYEGCQNEGTAGEAGNVLEFTLTDDAWFKVTDGFNIGDVFDVLVNGMFSFTTSTPGMGATLADPDDLFNSGYYSAGAVLLSAGSYTAEVFANQSPFGGGGAYLELESADQIPEPGILGLLGIALCALRFTRRTKSV